MIMSDQRELPYISIVVPFYNAQRYIAACVEALLAQTYPAERCEIIMVDNNSSDGSAEVVRRHARIKLLSEQRQGAYAARNRGLDEVQGEIIAFTDPDCVPASDWLGEVAEAMSDPAVQIVIGSHQFGGRGLLLSMLVAYEEEKKEYTYNSSIKVLYHGHNNNMAVRKRLFDQIGAFVERPRGADTIFVRRCVDQYGCSAVRHIPSMRVRHLEIDSVYKYYSKCSIYRRSRRAYRPMAFVRGLTNRERLLVFRRTVSNQGYSVAEAALLFALLTVGLTHCTLRSYLPGLERGMGKRRRA